MQLVHETRRAKVTRRRGEGGGKGEAWVSWTRWGGDGGDEGGGKERMEDGAKTGERDGRR